jgi:hypothetical protein
MEAIQKTETITIEQQARNLVNEMAVHHWNNGLCNYEGAKQCALIAIRLLILQNGSKNCYDLKKEIEKL